MVRACPQSHSSSSDGLEQVEARETRGVPGRVHPEAQWSLLEPSHRVIKAPALLVEKLRYGPILAYGTAKLWLLLVSEEVVGRVEGRTSCSVRARAGGAHEITSL